MIGSIPFLITDLTRVHTAAGGRIAGLAGSATQEMDARFRALDVDSRVAALFARKATTMRWPTAGTAFHGM